ncbi:hypothetical protein CB1_000300005 [Camelus ferus]|nr:hypothetical protein CB1_000300005 [Camelus ferus]
MEVEQKEDDEETAAAGRTGRSFSSRLQDSRSLDGLSGACGGATGSAGVAESGAGGGRRATISSPLELEGTTYRDAVDSLGEAVDMSIKGMYTLLARCEELERALQPVQGLARQVRDIRRTLEVLEALCK